MFIKKELYKIKKKYWNKLSILCYHRVEDLDADPVNITVGNLKFLKQIDWLKNSTNIITPVDFKNILINRGEFPKRAILLTFDDGYFSYQNTMSILKDKSIPAIFFISNPKNQFYWDLLTNKLLLPENILDRDIEIFYEILNSLNISITIEKSLNKDSLEIIKKWKSLSKLYPFERCRAFSYITNKLEIENPFTHNSAFNKLNQINKESHELTFLSSEPDLINYHTIGSHTSNHFNLNSLSKSHQKNEILENKVKLEKDIKKKIEFFAYPYGSREHYNEHSVDLVKKYFKFSFSNFTGNVHKDSNIHELPRYLVRNWDINEFKTKIEGFIRGKK